MPIETICQGCAKKLRVDDQFAGRQARCPHCRRVYTVPELVEPEASDRADAWQLRTEDGAVYGPVGRAELDQWCAEGRITGRSEIRPATDEDWHAATDFYPQVREQPSATNPFAATAHENPTQAQPVPDPQSILPEHRGGLILTVGIVGVICCQFAAPVAWMMGHGDLRAMDSGRMNPEGRSLTQAGMILGIIGSALLLSYFGFQIFAF